MAALKLKTLLGTGAVSPEHWVGDGFFVRTVFAVAPDNAPIISPFLMLDYAAPKTFTAATKPRGVGEHPHRGFETVTFAYAGEISHRDSAGGGGTIGPGDVQWMTAASGVVHEEFHSSAFTSKGGDLEMVQLWVNLPARLKMSSPRYQGLSDVQFPRVAVGDAASARLIAGVLGDRKGPALTHTPMLVFDVDFARDGAAAFAVPAGYNTLLFVLRGAVTIGDAPALTPRDLGVLSPEGEQVAIKGTAGTLLLVLAGEPIAEPVVAYGPFVMNTEAEIKEAIADYQAGKMGRLKRPG